MLSPLGMPMRLTPGQARDMTQACMKSIITMYSLGVALLQGPRVLTDWRHASPDALARLNHLVCPYSWYTDCTWTSLQP